VLWGHTAQGRDELLCLASSLTSSFAGELSLRSLVLMAARVERLPSPGALAYRDDAPERVWHGLAEVESGRASGGRGCLEVLASVKQAVHAQLERRIQGRQGM
jgi:hypothetical protein